MALRRVCVFCGSSAGRSPHYAAAAASLGRALAQRGMELVFGGGKVGLMGALADAALAAGGVVHGVIPHALVKKELAHPGVTASHVVDTMHQRKQLMADLADAFVALPGGMGTLDEVCEVLTWAQLGLHGKPVGLLNVRNYFAGFLAQLDHAREEGLLRPDHRAMLQVADDPAALLAALEAYRPTTAEKWITRRDA